MRGVKIKKSQLKNRILEKTGGLCAACGRTLEYEKVTIEHFIPRYRGGTDDERNLLPLCRDCNKSKGSRLVIAEDHYPYLKNSFYSDANEYKTEWENGGDFYGNSKDNY